MKDKKKAGLLGGKRRKVLSGWLVAFTFACTWSFPAVVKANKSKEDSIQTSYSYLSPHFMVKADTAVRVNESEVRAGLLYDAVNRKIVWQKNLQNAYPIASLTKMMVALLAVEDVKAGIYTWEDLVTWKRQIVIGRGKHRRTSYTDVSYTLRDVFKAAMIASNNECSEQLARFLGNGDLPAAINRMNARARELGMMNTQYGNPTGLPASSWMNDNSSTPMDQLFLALELLKYQEAVDIAAMGYASIDNGRSQSIIRNHNRLTIDYSGEVDGLKTGYTKRAGFCLVATTAKCEHRLISVVFGCRAPQIRNDLVRDMINDYYAGIGLDRLGPNYIAPGVNLARASSVPAQTTGEVVTVKEQVKKIHHVKSGQTLGGIAAQYKCTQQQIKSWNKSIRGGTIYAGQKLVVYQPVNRKVHISKPANGSEEEDDKPLNVNSEAIAGQKTDAASPADKTAVEKKTITVEKPNPQFVYHIVIPGDTLFSIARKYDGITVEQLKTINRITDSRALKPGMKLKVPVKKG